MSSSENSYACQLIAPICRDSAAILIPLRFDGVILTEFFFKIEIRKFYDMLG